MRYAHLDHPRPVANPAPTWMWLAGGAVVTVATVATVAYFMTPTPPPEPPGVIVETGQVQMGWGSQSDWAAVWEVRELGSGAGYAATATRVPFDSLLGPYDSVATAKDAIAAAWTKIIGEKQGRPVQGFPDGTSI